MNCSDFHDLIQRRLDGHANSDAVDPSPHLATIRIIQTTPGRNSPAREGP